MNGIVSPFAIALESSFNHKKEPVPLHRYWNNEKKDHFYTTIVETNTPRLKGYQYEGIECYVYSIHPDDLSAPLYCYWSEEVYDHYYSSENLEVIRTENLRYVRQWNVGYSATNSRLSGYRVVRLYQYWNSETRDHFYTVNEEDNVLTDERYVRQDPVYHVLVPE